MKTDKELTDKWGPVVVPQEIKRDLIRSIIRGSIDRDNFPALWPEKLLIIVNWPEGD